RARPVDVRGGRCGRHGGRGGHVRPLPHARVGGSAAHRVLGGDRPRARPDRVVDGHGGVGAVAGPGHPGAGGGGVVRLVLLGYFGFGNTGDEAVLAAEVAALRRELGDDTEFVVISGDPAHTRAVHGLAAVPRTSMPAIVQAIRFAD